MRGGREGRRRKWAAGILGLSLMVWAAGAMAEDPASDPLSMLKKRETERAAAPATQAVQDRDPQTSRQQRLVDLKGISTDAARCAELAPTLTQEQVKASVQKGADYLLGQLQAIFPEGAGGAAGGTAGTPDVDQHIWRGFAGDQRVGMVALAVQALIEAGRMTDDPRLHPLSKELSPAVTYLATVRTQQTYSAALQAGALAMLPARAEYRRALTRVRDDLAAGMRDDGGFGYSLASKSQWDNSNTQYAVLGMWSAAEAGVEVPLRFWKAEDAHWRQMQGPQGGWGYWELVRDFKVDTTAPGAKQTPALTAAGLASLYVTMDQLGTRAPLGGDRAMETALMQVGSDFRENMETMSESLYYMYGIERVGVASGRKYLDRIDWYRRGAAALVLAQRADGAWLYAGDLPGTSLGILFLTHGGAPVIFNVLQYGLPGQWDPQPRAAAKVTRWMSRTLERRLNWQVVSVESPAGEWLDAPILLISGKTDPGFAAQEIAKLRAFVLSGGMVVSLGDGEQGPFSTAMKKIASAVVDNKYEMRKLPPNHPLYTLSEKMDQRPDLEGISNGVREVWVHSPIDLGATWQRLEYHAAAHWQLAENLMLYATGQEKGRGRLDSVVVAESPRPPAMVTLGRVNYTGNWDPEPWAWPRLGALMARDGQVGLHLLEVEAGKLDVHQSPVVHVTGTSELKLSDAERAGLAKFLAEGGVLIGDAAGGSEAFARSFEALAKELTGQTVTEMVQPDSAMFDATLPGSVKLVNLDYRKPLSGPRKVADKGETPVIEVWQMKAPGAGRILFSRMDLTSGLLGTEAAGITGYRPATAQRVARDLVIYANSLAKPQR